MNDEAAHAPIGVRAHDQDELAQAALEQLGRRAADALVVVKLDRFSLSMLDLAFVMGKAEKDG